MVGMTTLLFLGVCGLAVFVYFLWKRVAELDNQIGLITDQLAEIYIRNNHPSNNQKRIKCGLLLAQAIELQIYKEAKYLADQKLEEYKEKFEEYNERIKS